jgi:hypothetical protein
MCRLVRRKRRRVDGNRFVTGGVLMRQTVALAAANRRCQAVGATFRRGSSLSGALELTFCPRDAFFHHLHPTSLIPVVKAQAQALEGARTVSRYLVLLCTAETKRTLHCSRDSLQPVAWPIRDIYRTHGLHRRQPAGQALVAERNARSHLDRWTVDSLSQVRNSSVPGPPGANTTPETCLGTNSLHPMRLETGTDLTIVQATRRAHRTGMAPAHEGVICQQEAGPHLPRKR